jgi:hypothetical protein
VIDENKPKAEEALTSIHILLEGYGNVKNYHRWLDRLQVLGRKIGHRAYT